MRCLTKVSPAASACQVNLLRKTFVIGRAYVVASRFPILTTRMTSLSLSQSSGNLSSLAVSGFSTVTSTFYRIALLHFVFGWF